MEELNKNQKDSTGNQRQDVHSISIRAGKRTYFFDVKKNHQENFFLTITESKRRFNNQTGKFYYEKHKIYLYPEDLIKFSEGLNSVIDKIKELYNGTLPEPVRNSYSENGEAENEEDFSDQNDIKFEDL